MPITPVIDLPSCLVQYSDTLPTNDGGWSNSTIIPRNGQEGCGQNYGSFNCEYNYGNVSAIGGSSGNDSSSPVLPGDWTGAYMRVLVEDNAGTVYVAGVAYKVAFTGICDHVDTIPDGSTSIPGGMQKITIAGLPSILDNIYVNSGFMSGYAADTNTAGVTYPLECPEFNASPTQFNNTLGEMSSSPGALGNSLGTSHYFNLVSRALPWTALAVVQYLLNGYGNPQIPPDFTTGGPTWVVADPTGLLAYIPDKLDFDSKSVLDCVNMLINQRRGGTWYYTVLGNTITFNVYSTSNIAISASSTLTIPASTLQVTLDTTENPLLSDLSISEDAKSCFDYIEVRGNKPLIGMTLAYNLTNGATCALSPGWDQSLNPPSTSGPDGAWNPDINQGPAYEYIWRRFTLNTGWNGSQYVPSTAAQSATAGLRNQLTISADGTSTNGGYDGTRAFSLASGEYYVPGPTLKLDRFFPVPYNYQFTNTPILASALDMTEPLSAPMVFLVNTVAPFQVRDYSSSIHVEIEENPPAIVISGSAERIHEVCGFVNAGFSLCVSIGIHESDPLTVSWVSPTPLSEIPRVLVRKIPYCEQWLALKGSILSTVKASSYQPITLQQDLLVVDDTAKLQAWLAVLQNWYGQVAVTCTWCDRSQIDTATGPGSFQPGALITSINRGDTDIDANCVITGRAWDFSDDSFGTTYTTSRIIPDVVSIEGHPMLKMQRERRIYGPGGGPS